MLSHDDAVSARKWLVATQRIRVHEILDTRVEVQCALSRVTIHPPV
jgi:hypothetical protein